MSAETLTKDQLLQQFASGYERLIARATQADQRDASHDADGWGPRQVVAHLAGWELMAHVRIPAIVAGMRPAEFDDPSQARVMNDAINGAFVALAADQPVATLSAILRRAYQQTLALLTPLDASHFQPGQYVYERTTSVIDHCQEHIDVHLSDVA